MSAYTTWARPWKHKLDVSDVFYNDDLTLREKRDEIVRRIKAAPFYVEDPDFETDEYELREIVEELSDLGEYDDADKNDDELVRDFDAIWSSLYDWADKDKRLWIETMRVIGV